MAEHRFQCVQCREILRNKKSTINHYVYNHVPKENTNYTCSVCGYHTSSKNRFFHHPKGFKNHIIHRSKLPNPVSDDSLFRIQNLKQRFTFGKTQSANHIWIIDTDNQENSEPSKEMKQQSEESDVLDLMDTDCDLDMASDFGKKEEEWREEKRNMEEEMKRMHRK